MGNPIRLDCRQGHLWCNHFYDANVAPHCFNSNQLAWLVLNGPEPVENRQEVWAYINEYSSPNPAPLPFISDIWRQSRHTINVLAYVPSKSNPSWQIIHTKIYFMKLFLWFPSLFFFLCLLNNLITRYARVFCSYPCLIFLLFHFSWRFFLAVGVAL